MMTALRSTSLGRLARRVRWSLPTRAQPGSSEGSGRLSLPVTRSVMEAETPVEWVARVENHSRHTWARAGAERCELRYQWVSRTGQTFGPAGVKSLPRALMPGDWADMPVAVTGPEAVGDFTLCWNVVVRGKALETGGESVPVHVTFPRSTDIDYHRVYRTADLNANSWFVVGNYQSREEMLRSSLARREMLEGLGLTPDSRVLDIGCGTGQMAHALADYLTERGAYYGTDIGREAIDFCQATYHRPNFVFAPGDMTRVPFADDTGPFDLAIFFSVFTHTFIDETVLLLAEARRLLRTGGAVVADVIASDHVDRAAGHRGQMWVNRDHLLRLAGTLDYHSEIVGVHPWGNAAHRVMLRFTKN